MTNPYKTNFVSYDCVALKKGLLKAQFILNLRNRRYDLPLVL